MFLTTLNSKRNGKILKRLYQLNFASCCDGFFQLLKKIDFDLNDIKGKKRSIFMILFVPSADDCEDFLQQENQNVTTEIHEDESPSNFGNITEKAVEFCEEYKLDCNSSKVFVNNIDFHVKQKELWDFFEYFGKVLRCSIIKDRKTKRSRGFAFVIFSSPHEANCAINAKKYELRLNGRLMIVKPAEKQKKRGKNNTYADGEQKLKDAAHYFLDGVNTNNEDVEKVDTINNISEDEICFFELLCNDLVLEIFSYLDLVSRVRIELVCRKWQNLAIESWSQVYHIDFRNVFQMFHTYAGLTDRILMSLLKKGCQNLLSFDFSASPYLLSHHSLEYLGNVCQKLEELNLSQVPVQNKTLKHLGSKLLLLKKITLVRCLNVGEKGFWWLFKDLKYLEYLKVTETSRLAGKCLYMLPDTVKTVDFSSCAKLSDLGLESLTSHCPHLCHVNLSFCTSISDVGLNVLMKHCSNISQLKLKAMGPAVTSIGLLSLQNLENLILVDISQNNSVNDDVIKLISKSCSFLRSLNLEACHGDITCKGIKSLCFLDELTELNLSYIMKVCDVCLSEIALQGKLEILLVRSCPEITRNGVVTCLVYLDSLSKLDVSGCYTVGGDLIYDDRLHKVRGTGTAVDIILGGTEVTEDGISRLKETFSWCKPSLQNLSVSMFRNDRDPTYIEIFSDDDEEEEEENKEEEETKQLVKELPSWKTDLELDVNIEYPTVDEDGEKLWVVENCLPSHSDDTENSIQNKHIDNPTNKMNFSSDAINIFKKEDLVHEEENWEEEIDEGRVWQVPVEHLQYYNAYFEPENDFSDNDDVSRNELIG